MTTSRLNIFHLLLTLLLSMLNKLTNATRMHKFIKAGAEEYRELIPSSNGEPVVDNVTVVVVTGNRVNLTKSLLRICNLNAT